MNSHSFKTIVDMFEEITNEDLKSQFVSLDGNGLEILNMNKLREFCLTRESISLEGNWVNDYNYINLVYGKVSIKTKQQLNEAIIHTLLNTVITKKEVSNHPNYSWMNWIAFLAIKIGDLARETESELGDEIAEVAFTKMNE